MNKEGVARTKKRTNQGFGTKKSKRTKKRKVSLLSLRDKTRYKDVKIVNRLKKSQKTKERHKKKYQKKGIKEVDFISFYPLFYPFWITKG
jgi:hypothetical protein